MSQPARKDEDLLSWIASWIETEIGVRYSAGNRYQLEARLAELTRFGKSLDDICEDLRNPIGNPTKERLLELSTNHETMFFRDERVFDLIEKTLIPEWLERRQPLRIWSAASSSGQEIYSLALLLERCGVFSKLPHVELFASDVSREIVEKAKLGRYRDFEVTRGLSQELLASYFVKTDKDFQIKKELRDRIRFSVVNLLKGPVPRGQMDLILCRNVLIYFSLENRRKVVDQMNNASYDQTRLILGAGETLLGVTELWNGSLLDGVTLYRRR